MTFSNPAALGLLVLAVPVVLVHVLRPRRPPVTVSSTYLWEEVARPVSAASPWQRLRPSLLLLLQLLAVALLAVAAARPVRLTDAPLARHTVFILDASGSMAATDGAPDRLAVARRRALALRRQLPAGGLASVVVASAQPRVTLSASADPAAFADAVRSVRTAAGAADFATAFTLAESTETSAVPVGFVLLSDGGLTTEEKRQLPPGTRYVRTGERSTNRAITRLVVEPRGSGLRALVTLRNTGGPEATQTLRLDVDGRTAATAQVRLPVGVTVERGIDLPGGDRVEAFLEGEDLLPADDHAFAVAARRRPLRVLVAGPGEPFLERLLAAIPGVSVESTPQARPAPGYDLAVYDRVPVPADPGAPFLAIAPPGGAPGVKVAGEVERPAVTLVRHDHPLVSGLDLSEVDVAAAQRVEAPGDEVVVGAEGTPLLLRGSRQGRPFAYLAFALADSDLPLQVAFPILGDRLLTELSGAALPPTDLRVGQPLPVAGGVRVRHPGGAVDEVAPGAPPPVASRPGFHVVQEAGRPDRLLAVNADPRESELSPAESLPVPARPAQGGARRPAGELPLLPWVLAAVLALLVVELLVSRRSIGVSRRQWRAGLVVRAAIVTLLVAALAGAALPRPGRGVGTLFLVDGSDSLGAGGREVAVEWVREALERSPDGARAGVAFFGGDARLELTVQRGARLVQPAVRVDTTRTNLAGALRLAGAVLPADARRRVVVVSDGRATEGDAAAEAQRLREAGIRVDVHPVVRSAGPDAAIARVEAPARVRQGERVELRAVVSATAAGPARVTLQRDGTVVEDRVVELGAGETVIDLAQPAGGPGLTRFRVEVQGPGDAVPENDAAFAGVEVEGPARVLVAEGAPGNGAALAAALRAGGLQVDVVGAPALAPLDRLATYASTVLVDVDVRSLSGEQVAALGAATRDLGRGLVVVGGHRSYALGGYRDSELEKLLPVVSDITDPKRRDSVAQVLAIDSSGSMGACHCAEGANGIVTGGNQGQGGVNKTDISRAGAARAIRALSANDQVGVLAFNTEQKFVVPLQKLPAEDVVTKGLRGLKPAGGTDIPPALDAAAAKLRSAKAKLKHIILFTDGFTSEGDLAELEDQAAALAAEGITVSVLATGEGASTELRRVSEAGRGRFYPGRDLNEIPQIMMQEAVIASRNFVNEGQFFPKVVSAAPPVRDLRESPPLLGYVATTARPTAETALRIGPDDDPLLASWRLGLGRATAWTSDASARWSQQWSRWGGYAPFWSAVVKDTFPLATTAGAGVRAVVEGDRLRIVAESEAPWPDGATAVARVAGPDLVGSEVQLERTSGTTFAAEVPASRPGTYAVGVSVTSPSGPALAASTLANQAYSPEYRPGPAEPEALVRVSLLSGGRGAIGPADAFDPDGLPVGRSRVALAGWLLLAAALLWPVDVALRRINLQGAGVTAVRAGRRRLAASLRRLPVIPGRERPPPPRRPAAPAAPPPPPPTLGRLLDRKRQGRGDQG